MCQNKILSVFVIFAITLSYTFEDVSAAKMDDDAINKLRLDSDEFMMVRDYMDQTYVENPSNTTNTKWFNSHKSANGYIAYDGARNSIVIAFQGSKTKINGQYFAFSLIPYAPCSYLNGCKVHKGFLETYYTAKLYIFQNFKIFQSLYPKARIYVTGYSLGAAQADLCAVELSLLGHRVNLMTFGSPRVGNKEFASFANTNLKGINYRVSFQNDAVTALPMRIQGFWHIGTELNFNIKNEYKFELPKYSDKTFLFRPYSSFDHARINYNRIFLEGGSKLKFNRNEFRMVKDYMDRIYGENQQNTTQIKWFHTDKHAYGYVAYDGVRDTIIIAFGGTKSLVNMQQNVKLDLIPYTPCFKSNACKVHEGFLHTYNTAKQYIFQNFKMFQGLHPKAKIYVTGFSLGAAQADLCAVELSLFGHRVNLMTFGSPRVGNKEFASFANTNLKGINYRVSFQNDAVTAMPIRAMGYHHLGTEVNFNKNSRYKIENPQYSDKTYLFRPYHILDHFWTNYNQLN